MNRFAKMKKERIYTLFETLSAKMKKERIYTLFETLSTKSSSGSLYLYKNKKVMVILPRIRGEDTSFSKLIQSLLVAHTVRIG